MKMSRVVLSAVAAVAVVAAVGISTVQEASAAENTLVKNYESKRCLVVETFRDRLGVTSSCNPGDRRQLFDRRGANIVRAFTNQCVAATSTSSPHLEECNGSRSQMWDFRSDGSVVNVQSVQWLLDNTSLGTFPLTTTRDPARYGQATKWAFKL